MVCVLLEAQQEGGDTVHTLRQLVRATLGRGRCEQHVENGLDVAHELREDYQQRDHAPRVGGLQTDPRSGWNRHSQLCMSDAVRNSKDTSFGNNRCLKFQATLAVHVFESENPFLHSRHSAHIPSACRP